MNVSKEKPITLSGTKSHDQGHVHTVAPSPPYELPKVHLSKYQDDMLYIKTMLDELRKDMDALIERVDEMEALDA